MPNINIKDGSIAITVNDDPARVIRFNPEDVCFVERFYNLIADYDTKAEEFKARGAAIADDNISAGVSLLKEICEDMKARIDGIFGKGTSAAAFGDALTYSMFEQFFNGITPFIVEARNKKISKYNNTKRSGVLK